LGESTSPWIRSQTNWAVSTLRLRKVCGKNKVRIKGKEMRRGRKSSSTQYNPFLYGWLNDNFQKEFRILLPCLFTLFRRFGGSANRRGIETTLVADNRGPAAHPVGPTDTIRLQQLGTERNGCRAEEQKMLVQATMDNVHHQYGDSEADD